MRTARVSAGVAGVFATLLTALPGSLLAQPIPVVFDHLKCHRVKDPLHLLAQADLRALQPQFTAKGCVIGKPELFCAPVQKLNVSPKPPRPDVVGGPLRNDFICYRLRCDDKRIQETVTDQFGTREQVMGNSELLCVPARKERPTTTTTTSTTTTSTTTTTIPNDFCRLVDDPTGAPVCAGVCPNPSDVCLTIPGSIDCECFPSAEKCQLDAAGICSGLCPSPLDVCVPVPGTNGCDCLRHEPVPCGLVDDPTGVPVCAGGCPSPDLACLSNPDTGQCDCLPAQERCQLEDPANMLCGGLCPQPGAKCAGVPDTGTCECLGLSLH